VPRAEAGRRQRWRQQLLLGRSQAAAWRCTRSGRTGTDTLHSVAANGRRAAKIFFNACDLLRVDSSYRLAVGSVSSQESSAKARAARTSNNPATLLALARQAQQGRQARAAKV
jgi:hypothetical protein